MGGCNGMGWPARGLNDYVERWNTATANWQYDGDEDITDGVLSVVAPATSTYLIFSPVQDFLPFPRPPSTPHPFNLWSKVNSICVAGTNTALYLPTIAVDAGFLGDYVQLIWSYQTSTNTYWIELLVQRGGVSDSIQYDTGIARVDDRTDDIIISVGLTAVTIILNGVPVMWESGFYFTNIGYCDVGIQRFAANRQAQLNYTEIWTTAP